MASMTLSERRLEGSIAGHEFEDVYIDGQMGMTRPEPENSWAGTAQPTGLGSACPRAALAV